ncbi:MAG: Gfo/Idh/MocA family oxidoreductase [Acidimicrobiales bacterium]
MPDRDGRLNVAIVGLGFGAEFIPIYQHHPNTNMYAICQRTQTSLDAIGDQFGIDKRYTELSALLADDRVDAVHINSPIPLHADQTIAALNAGKHVACTVPAATSVDELHQIVGAARRSKRNYMMMETSVYAREFLYLRQLRDRGELGRIQFLRGSHHQDMSAWPGYWRGLPPMHYATHCIGPCLALAGRKAASVYCLGSGHLPDDLVSQYGSPFAVETALIRLEGSDLTCEVSRSLYETAREYIESFDVYGSKRSFEWNRLAADRPVVFTGETAERIEVPDFASLLPEPVRQFTRHGVYGEQAQHLSFLQGSGHGGSHPHLVHEFVSSIVEGRQPFPNAEEAANWTATGLCAHSSAMANGSVMPLPMFSGD